MCGLYGLVEHSSVPSNIGYVLTCPVSDFLGSTLFLSLSSKNLHGLIPVSICNANELIILDLLNNSLSGRIPQCLGAMSNLRVTQFKEKQPYENYF